MLGDLKIDRIEVASARVSEGELNSVKEISSWAESNSRINSIEVLTFIDEGKSIQWLLDSGCKVQNLLTKGSLNPKSYCIENDVMKMGYNKVCISKYKMEKKQSW